MHETPLFMRVPENPVVRNNAAWGRPKSMEKLRFSTVFLGFCTYFSRNCWFLPVFCHFWATQFFKDRPFEPSNGSSVQPEEHLLLGRDGRRDWGIQRINHRRQQSEMLDQNLGKILP